MGWGEGSPQCVPQGTCEPCPGRGEEEEEERGGEGRGGEKQNGCPAADSLGAQPCPGMWRILLYTKPQGGWAGQLLQRRLQNPTVSTPPFLANLWVHSAHVPRPVCPPRPP